MVATREKQKYAVCEYTLVVNVRARSYLRYIVNLNYAVFVSLIKLEGQIPGVEASW